VDDNEINRDVLCRRLERLGHAAATADNGRRALAMIGTGSFDLVLLDIMMPELDGYQVLEQVKADPARRDLPIIMISAVDEIQSVVRCIERGAEDYLPKPFDPVLLRARLGACLEKKRLRDQELDYLRNVATLTTAAAAVQAETFEPDSLAEVTRRSDELGQLARVFQHMAGEVYAREQRLKQQVQQLRVEIDEARKARQVAEITETDYFQTLQQKAQNLRRRMGKEEGGR
jgi:CheY-like chemotaxis protein